MFKRRRPQVSRYEPHKKIRTQAILPIFKPSGLLEKDLASANKNYTEPNDAVIPKQYWQDLGVDAEQKYKVMVYRKMHNKPMKEYELFNKSCYIVGNGDKCDIILPEESVEQPQCVFQFRKKNGLNCYVIGLESSNGAFLNGIRLPNMRYVELRAGDIITFSGETEYELVFVSL